MKVITVSFGDSFDHMADVLGVSVVTNSPHTLFENVRLNTPDSVNGHFDCCVYNTAKLHAWRDAVAKSDRRLVLMDADTVVLNDLHPAFNLPYDVAITTRPGLKWFNGGVVFVRPTLAARRFFDAWVARNDWLMQRRQELDKRLELWGGVNQSALADRLEHPPTDCMITYLPCSKWNCVDQVWPTFDESTAVVHLKGRLRSRLVTGERGMAKGQHEDRIIDAYRRIENLLLEPAR